jgi:hypothetical protein
VRGQTTTDFTVGMGLFLVTLVVVVGFLPSVFGPFDTDTGSQAVVAERVADRLAADLLVREPTEPTVLNATCTAAFFAAGGSEPPGCRYPADSADLADAVGTRSFRTLNVTVEDGGAVETVEGTRLAAGPDPSGAASVVTTRRTVLLDDDAARLVVRVW